MKFNEISIFSKGTILCKVNLWEINQSATKLTMKDEGSRHSIFPFSMYVSMKNMWGKSLMLIFSFTQIFFSPVYKFGFKVIITATSTCTEMQCLAYV